MENKPASLLIVCILMLDKALNVLASTLKWLDWKKQVAAWFEDRKGHFAVSWSR